MPEHSEVLSIKQLFESPLNPRRTYNEKKMEELVESIRTKGILMPLLVRPNDGRFEIAAGHRRYRAAIKVGLQEAPVIIREMSDIDFLEILTIENLQREDLEPLDEAQGYRTLMEKAGYEVPSIAAKIGKSESYIYQRLKLLELIPEAQKQLTEDKITAGHAILIARLQPEEQKECLDAIKEEADYGNGMSVRDLADHIETQIHLDLNSASFSKKDPDLVPEAGPCTTCPKRTGFTPALFPDIKKKDTCTDPSCFHRKLEAYTAQWLAKQSQDSDVPPLRLSRNYDARIKKLPEDPVKPIPSNLWTEIANKKKESCASAREGIVVEGYGQGQVMTVCADPKCQKHHGQYESSTEMGKWRAQQKAAEEKRKQEKILRLRIIDAILKKMPAEPSREDLIFIADQFYGEIWNEHQKSILSRHEIKPAKVQYGFDFRAPFRKHLESCGKTDLYKLFIEMALIRNSEARHWTDKRKEDSLMTVASRHKIKIKVIEAELKQELKEKTISKARKKIRKKTESGICRVCGCTDDTPCEGPGGVLCAWTDKTKTLCTSCAEKPKLQTSAKSKKEKDHSK